MDQSAGGGNIVRAVIVQSRREMNLLGRFRVVRGGCGRLQREELDVWCVANQRGASGPQNSTVPGG